MGELAMLTLSARGMKSRNLLDSPARMVMRVNTHDRPEGLRALEAFLITNANLPEGFGLYAALTKDAAALNRLPPQAKTILLPDELSYLADGDILRIWPKNNQIRVLYRRGSIHNHFLLTERCNHYCLMCSQPPKKADDSWIVEDVLAAIPLIDTSVKRLALPVANRLCWTRISFEF
jgi:hypothetical protein